MRLDDFSQSVYHRAGGFFLHQLCVVDLAGGVFQDHQQIVRAVIGEPAMPAAIYMCSTPGMGRRGRGQRCKPRSFRRTTKPAPSARVKFCAFAAQSSRSAFVHKYDRSCYCEFVTGAAASRHQQILHVGLAMMSQTGLGGVTLGLLSTQVGMSKSGLFAHFRSKEEVQIALLQYMGEFATEHVVEPSMNAEPGLPRVRALVSHWFGWAQRAGLPGGCPIAAGLFEFDDVGGAVRNKILEMEGSWRQLLTQLVQEAVSRKHLRADLDTGQFVWELCAIYLGHHAAHRFFRASDAESRTATALEALLKRAMPETPRRIASRNQRTRKGQAS